MKILHWLEYQKEIEIDLSIKDMSILQQEAYGDDPVKTVQVMLNNLNSIAGFLTGITNEIINDITEKQQETISRFLKEQGMRFEPLPPKDGAQERNKYD